MHYWKMPKNALLQIDRNVGYAYALFIFNILFNLGQIGII